MNPRDHMSMTIKQRNKNAGGFRVMNPFRFVTVAVLLLSGLADTQAQKTAPASQPVKPATAALPTPTPTPTPGSTKGKPAGAAQPGSVQMPTAPVAPAAKPSGPAGAAAVNLAGGADVDQMTSQQFKALPSTGMLRYKGQSMTKAAFTAQRKKEFFAQRKSAQTKPTTNFEAARAQFEQKQAAGLAAKNARVKAVADRYDLKLKQLSASSAYSALLKEADGIVQRYPSASSAEKAKLKQRAAEVHMQLLKLEQDAASGH
jgi:hypothetical protein